MDYRFQLYPTFARASLTGALNEVQNVMSAKETNVVPNCSMKKRVYRYCILSCDEIFFFFQFLLFGYSFCSYDERTIRTQKYILCIFLSITKCISCLNVICSAFFLFSITNFLSEFVFIQVFVFAFTNELLQEIRRLYEAIG